MEESKFRVFVEICPSEESVHIPNRFCQNILIELSIHSTTNNFLRLILLCKVFTYCRFDNRVVSSIWKEVDAVIHIILEEKVEHFAFKILPKIARLPFVTIYEHRDVLKEEEEFLHVGVPTKYNGSMSPCARLLPSTEVLYCRRE